MEKAHSLYVMTAWRYHPSTIRKTEIQVRDTCPVTSVIDHDSFYEVRVLHQGEELVTFGQYQPGDFPAHLIE